MAGRVTWGVCVGCGCAARGAWRGWRVAGVFGVGGGAGVGVWGVVLRGGWGWGGGGGGGLGVVWVADVGVGVVEQEKTGRLASWRRRC